MEKLHARNINIICKLVDVKKCIYTYGHFSKCFEFLLTLLALVHLTFFKNLFKGSMLLHLQYFQEKTQQKFLSIFKVANSGKVLLT